MDRLLPESQQVSLGQKPKLGSPHAMSAVHLIADEYLERIWLAPHIKPAEQIKQPTTLRRHLISDFFLEAPYRYS
jgi:hypothetical protein